jgi:hypothetical protein
VNLDDRLASAADAVRNSVRHEPPSFDDVRARARRRRTIVAGTAMVVVAVLAVFVIVPLATSGSKNDRLSVRPGGDSGSGDVSSCQPVPGHDGLTQVGCELAADATAGAARLAELETRFGGIPVYRDASAQVQVGVLVPDVGFVRSDLVPQLAELRACWPAVLNMLADPVAAPLDPSCHALMAALGYPESFLEGKGYGR